MNYERNIFQFLSVYRFLSFAIAVVLAQVLPLRAAETPTLQTYLVLSILGVYSLLKVFSPIRWQRKGPMTYIVLVGDLVVCIALILYTGGLNSAFLLYSLIPIITAALLFEAGIALFTAAASSFSLIIAHTGLSQFSDNFVWVMQHNYLPLLIMYILVCFLIATLTYRTNLNIFQRIQGDAILDERRRIRQELHDGVAQVLSYLNMKTKLVGDSVSSHKIDQALSGLSDIKKMVQDTYDNIRESIDQLSVEAKSLPLIPTLSKYIREYSQKNKILVNFDAPGELSGLSPVAELQLLRIAQEALTNVRRHAQATQAWVKLEDDGRKVKMMVRDNGQGLPSRREDYEEDPTGRRGLTIMKERAESLGGTLTISTAPGMGTEIMVSLPGQKVRL